MRRTIISLPDELAGALDREARRRPMPAPAIARDALTAYLGIGGPGDRRSRRSVAVVHSDTAREMEELLEQERAVDGGGR